MVCFINWCNNNQGFLAALSAITTFPVSIIAIIVSIIVMIKTNKQDKQIELRQEDIQRRQLKVDTYPYRLECWKTLINLETLIDMISIMLNLHSFKEKSFINIFDSYQKLLVNSELTQRQVTLCLRQAETVFPVESWNKIKSIKSNFIKMDNAFAEFKFLDEYLSEGEKGDRKKHNVKIITECVKTLKAEIKSTISLVDIDLCIADLHSVRGIYNDGLEYTDVF